MLSHPITILGGLLLLHAAYSTVHYRTLSATVTPPADVIIEVSIGFLLALLGSISSLSLKDVREAGVAAFVGRDFDTFNHRQRPKRK